MGRSRRRRTSPDLKLELEKQAAANEARRAQAKVDVKQEIAKKEAEHAAEAAKKMRESKHKPEFTARELRESELRELLNEHLIGLAVSAKVDKRTLQSFQMYHMGAGSQTARRDLINAILQKEFSKG